MSLWVEFGGVYSEHYQSNEELRQTMDEATRQRLFEPFFYDEGCRPRYRFGIVDHLCHCSQSRWGDRRGERAGGGNDVQGDVAGGGERPAFGPCLKVTV